MPLYYFFSGLFLLIALGSLGVGIVKLNGEDTVRTSSLYPKPEDTHNPHKEILNSSLASVAYSVLLVAPTLAGAPSWVKLALGLPLIWLTVDAPIAIWKEMRELKKYREGIKMGKARAFLPEPGRAGLGLTLAALQLVLVVIASAIVYL